MRYLVTAAEMKRCDQNTISQIGMPGMVLMERAALQSFSALMERNLVRAGESALILVGYGNNGGDGLALARLLCEAGMEVEIWAVGDSGRATEQWRTQAGILHFLPVRYGNRPGKSAYTVIVDALFGVGLSRELSGEYAESVKTVNALEGFKMALDIPSGVDADNGQLWGEAFQADLTVTFGFEKRGLFLYPGKECAGEIKRVDVGIPERAFFGELPRMFYLEEGAEELLPKRRRDGNKGTFGKALLVAGSFQMAGAAVLCARACYRMGAGMLKLLTDADNRVIIQETIPEALFGEYSAFAESAAWCDVICIGPGLGKSAEAKEIMGRVLESADLDVPLVIDADGLNLIAEEETLKNALKEQGHEGREIVLTPHAGEFKRLYAAAFPEGPSLTMESVKREPWVYAERLAKEWNAVVVLKDARTFVCSPGEPICMNVSGNSGMATAGSGDVLAGMLTALLCQGLHGFDAACRAVRLHGLAGDRAAEKYGEHGLMAGDLVEAL